MLSLMILILGIAYPSSNTPDISSALRSKVDQLRSVSELLDQCITIPSESPGPVPRYFKQVVSLVRLYMPVLAIVAIHVNHVSSGMKLL